MSRSGEALQHAEEELLHRAEVVVHEPVVRARLLREAPGADARVADLDEQPLRRVQELLLGRLSMGLRRYLHRVLSRCLRRTYCTTA
jgi:hypothetical protein